jgi:hypothetical protein
MKSHLFGFALLSLTAIVASAPAQAASTRTFVSSGGVDTNPCTITQPCATFAQAFTQTLPNGIIAALDPGKYGALNITSPVTINGNGWAAITGTSGNNAININVSSGNVTLMGLEVDGAGAGLHGVYLTSPLSANATLNIRDCVVSNFLDTGIAIQPTSSNVTYFNVSIANTFSLNNGQNGIRIAPSASAVARGMITGTTVTNNANNGFDLEGLVAMTIANSVASSNSNYGIYNDAEASILTVIIIQDTTSTFNSGADFYAGAGSQTFLYHNTFVLFEGNGADLYSDGTNRIVNGPNGSAPTKQSTY